MSTATPQQQQRLKIPPLENGDRLNRLEFERRYAAMPESIKAELINGVVYMASPARHRRHGRQHWRLIGILFNYMAATPGADGGDNSTLRIDDGNEPQPDVLLRLEEEAGGQSTIDEEDYLHGTPELIGEIAASSVSYDLGPKLQMYQDQGAKEYIVWRVDDHAVDWFVSRDGQFEPLTPDASGVLKSENFPGLWLNVIALLRDDMPAVLQTLQEGLASAEHQKFVAELAKRMGKGA